MGELNQKPGHEEKHGLEHRTALNLETKGTHNTEEPGQMGRNTLTIFLTICGDNMHLRPLHYITLHYRHLAEALIQRDVHRSAKTEPGTS